MTDDVRSTPKDSKKRLWVPGQVYAAGFDPSVGRVTGVADGCGIVVVRLENPNVPGDLPTLAPYKLWSQPEGVRGWTVPRDEVEAALKELVEDPLCVGIRTDAPPGTGWMSQFHEWERLYDPATAKFRRGFWDARTVLTGHWVNDAKEELVAALKERKFQLHPDDEDLAHSILAWRRGPDGKLAKEHTGRSAAKTDLADAAAFAWWAYSYAKRSAPRRFASADGQPGVQFI